MKEKIKLNAFLDKCCKKERLKNVSKNWILQFSGKASMLKSHPKGTVTAKHVCEIWYVSYIIWYQEFFSRQTFAEKKSSMPIKILKVLICPEVLYRSSWECQGS